MNSNGGTHESPKRSVEEIITVLQHAKLKEDEVLPKTQVLYIEEKNTKNDHYMLLELDDHLLEAVKCNNTVVFKGEDEDNVVLCSENRTYEVKECETSNSLLFVPGLKFSKDLQEDFSKLENKYVVGINYKYLEVTKTKPLSDKIVKILENSKYKGPEQEFQYNEVKFFNFEELLDISQASRVEVQNILDEIEAVIIDDKIRLLEMEYQFRVLSYLLQSVDENSWKLDEVIKEDSIEPWKTVVPEEVLEGVFNIFTEKSHEQNGKILYKYINLKVCQFFAKVLLEYATKFNLNDFLQTWQESVPEGMKINEKMLSGIAIIDRSKQPYLIWAFPEKKLPINISDRFNALFKAKQKWTVDEITPYIINLTTEKMDANALLAKYARVSTVNGVRHYSAKHEY